MKYRFFMAVAALMALAACSSENDIIEPQQPATDGLLRTPVTITANYGEGDNAGTTRVAYTESGANISATWQISDQIEVVVDGQVSTLTLTNGAGTSSATFMGTISHTNPLTSTTPLVCYVKDMNNPSAVTVNSDGTYTYTSGTFLSQDGTLAGAARCNLFYGMTHYGDGTNISCNFSINTSMMKFTVDASGLTSGEATLSYKSDGTTLASATFAVAADGKNTVYMTIPAGHLTGAQTLHYVSAANSINATATLSDTQANFANGQTYSKTIVVLNSATGEVTSPNGAIICGTGGSDTHLTIAADATVKIDGASINTNGEHAGITCAGNATINLRGTNSVQASCNNYPGIFVPNDKTLTIGGSGSLTAKGGDAGAGIGSGYRGSCGNITINGGTVTATGGNYGAGIGSGFYGSSGTITISGGTVSATGGDSGAGIGSGYYGSCGSLSISGSSTHVTATGMESAACIGSGAYGSCGNITINGGTITAIGGSNSGAGIGSGFGSSENSGTTCGDITITGGTLTATGGDLSAGIGSATGSHCDDITINGGTVTAMGGFGAAGIGSGAGFHTSCGDIVISSGTVTATGGEYAAGIGSGSNSSCDDITINITVTQVKATKGNNNDVSIGIGTGDELSSCGFVTIGGTVYWDGSDYQNGGDTYLSTSPLVYPAESQARPASTSTEIER